MSKAEFDKNLKFEANGDIKIEKFIKVERGAVYNDGGSVTMNVYEEKPQHQKKEEKQESGVMMLSVEDEEMLLPMFKGDRENLRQFFAEVQGAEPEQVVAKVNAWIGDGRIAKKFNMNKFWQVLSDMKIYPYSYKALNKHVMR